MDPDTYLILDTVLTNLNILVMEMGTAIAFPVWFISYPVLIITFGFIALFSNS